jgi:hypothetical protein
MYNIVLFLHLIGVVLLVGSVTITLVSTLRVQTAKTVAELRSLTAATKRIEVVLAPAMVILIASGLYMVSQHSDHGVVPWTAGWVITSLVVAVLLGVIGNTIEARDAKRLHVAIANASDERPHDELRLLQLASSPIYSVFFGSSQVVALLYMMTNKPGLAVSIVACVIAAVVAFAAAAIRMRSVRRVTRTAVTDVV